MVSAYSDLPRILARIGTADRALKLGSTRPLISGNTGAAESQFELLKKSGRYVLGPTHGYVLSLCDGIENFYWSGARLVSTQCLLGSPDFDIEHRQPNMFLFVLGPERRSLGFDLTTRRNNGEMAVVEFDATGERARWPTLTAFMWHYVESLELEAGISHASDQSD